MVARPGSRSLTPFREEFEVSHRLCISSLNLEEVERADGAERRLLLNVSIRSDRALPTRRRHLVVAIGTHAHEEAVPGSRS